MSSESPDKAVLKVEVTGPGIVMLSVGGRVGIEEANDLQKHLDDIFKSGRTWVILSLRDLEFMCSAAMGTILSGVGEARRAGGEIIFTEISPKAKTIFEFLDVWDYITTAPDRDTAMSLVLAGKRSGLSVGPRPSETKTTAAELSAQFAEGVRLSKEGKLTEAISYFNAVLKVDKENAVALTWKANALERLAQYGEARRLYLRVCDAVAVTPQLKNYARQRLAAINKRLHIEAGAGVTPDDLAGVRASIARETGKEIAEALTQAKTVRETDEAFLESFRTWDGRGIKIATALGVNGVGGYYLWFGKRGVVIDPGPSFVANFINAGYRFVDIDAIFVTSPRWESSADFELLLNLMRRYNTYVGETAKKVDIYLSSAVYKKFGGWLSEAKIVIRRAGVAAVGQRFQIGNATVSVQPGGTGEAGSDDASIGLFFDDGTSRFGYVTARANSMLDAVANYFNVVKGRVLLVPVGAVYAEGDPRFKLDEDYLGVEGAVKIIADVRPALALLSDLGNVADPVALTATVTRATKIRCLPVDLGLRVNLASGNLIVGGKAIPPQEVTVRLTGDGRIAYHSPVAT